MLEVELGFIRTSVLSQRLDKVTGNQLKNTGATASQRANIRVQCYCFKIQTQAAQSVDFEISRINSTEPTLGESNSISIEKDNNEAT